MSLRIRPLRSCVTALLSHTPIPFALCFSPLVVVTTLVLHMSTLCCQTGDRFRSTSSQPSRRHCLCSFFRRLGPCSRLTTLFRNKRIPPDVPVFYIRLRLCFSINTRITVLVAHISIPNTVPVPLTLLLFCSFDPCIAGAVGYAKYRLEKLLDMTATVNITSSWRSPYLTIPSGRCFLFSNVFVLIHS